MWRYGRPYVFAVNTLCSVEGVLVLLISRSLSISNYSRNHSAMAFVVPVAAVALAAAGAAATALKPHVMQRYTHQERDA
jgi:hypothetical protein